MLLFPVILAFVSSLHVGLPIVWKSDVIRCCISCTSTSSRAPLGIAAIVGDCTDDNGGTSATTDDDNAVGDAVVADEFGTFE